MTDDLNDVDELADLAEQPSGDLTLFNLDMFVDVSTPHRRAEFLAGAFLGSYDRPSTIKNYSTGIRDFFSYLESLDADIHPIHGVQRAHIDTYLRSLTARGLKASSVGRRATTVCMFYKYLLGEGFIARDPGVNVRRPKVSRESTRDYLTRREFADWISAAKHEGGYPYALACTLAFNGVRIGAACAANVEDLTKFKYHHVLSVVEKGGQNRRLIVPYRTMDAINDALEGRVTGPLFLNTVGTRMNRESAGRICRRFARQARIAKNIVPHSIRHSAISGLLESGADITAARDFAGHVDISTTLIYDRRRRSDDAAGSYQVANWIAEVEA